MKRALLSILLSLIVLPSLVNAQDAPPAGIPDGSEEARLWGYIDGDKFNVRIGDKTYELNTIGADAPELDKGELGECYAQNATDRVKKLIPRKSTIWLETDKKATDKKDRLLRYVWIADDDGKAFMLNERLLKEGYASFVSKDGNTRYDARFKKAQSAAKKAKKGLWGDCDGPHAELKESRCLDVDPAIVDAIATGIIPETGATLRGAKAVRSSDYEKVWFVAADLEGPELDGVGEIGVWATNNIDDPNKGLYLIFAVDGFAQQFTDWGHGDTTDAHITMSDDGANEARSCVRDALS